MLNLKKIIGGLYITSVVSLGITGVYQYRDNIDTNIKMSNYVAGNMSYRDIETLEDNSPIRGTVSNVDTALSVRSAADINGEIKDRLSNDTSLQIEGAAGEWYEVSYDGKTGFVNKNYVTIEESCYSDIPEYVLDNLSTVVSDAATSGTEGTDERSTEDIIKENLGQAKTAEEENINSSEDEAVESASASEESVKKGRAVKAELTAYCNDAQCSGSWGGTTAMETTTRVGVIAAPSQVALGSKIYIPELESYKADGIFSVEDRGGAIKIKDDGTYIIDVWMPTHEQVEAFGRKTTTIYLMDQE